MAELLKAQLQEAIGNRELIELAIDEECQVAEGAPGYVKAQAEAKRRQMLKAVSLPGHKRCPVLNQVRRVVRTGTGVRQLRTEGRQPCAPSLVAVPDGQKLPSPSEPLGPAGW